ncbi:NAD(P)-binding domain-containing protein [Cellulomonas fimi]|uniref:NAD(P)-binding domain-containing protein n=2 Tax=Cellulomonadaceae TaxID=85016 RepID=A0A7Y0QG24_CELFI|nr:NAD(P)-binding domain-containing protein [Cellulomonas fimi]
MHDDQAQTIGVLGAGKAGSAIARLALRAGLDVLMASSRPTADLTERLLCVAPGARATSTEQLLAEAELAILAVPLRRFRELPLALLADHVVVDLMNDWPSHDGMLPDFAGADRPSSVIVQDALPTTARLVKTLNHLGYHQIEELARPAGSTDRAALAVAGDDPNAVATVARLIDRLGFDAVRAGTLHDSATMQPGSVIFGMHLGADSMRRALVAATGDTRAA